MFSNLIARCATIPIFNFNNLHIKLCHTHGLAEREVLQAQASFQFSEGAKTACVEAERKPNIP